jgi:aminoglycoside phosphotransferase (APT) family kinase protein
MRIGHDREDRMNKMYALCEVFVSKARSRRKIAATAICAALAIALAVDNEVHAAFRPSPDAGWSMVVVPDTQNYVKDTAYRPILTQMTEWIRDHRAQWKIQVVLQEGDIVNQNSQVTPTSGKRQRRDRRR